MFGCLVNGKYTFVATTHSSRFANSFKRPPRDLLADSHRIHVGRVEEIDAALDRGPEKGAGLPLVQDPRPPLWVAVAHAAQAQPRDRHSRSTQVRIFHVPLTS